MTKSFLKKAISKLPATPGIYMFKSEKGKQLYIGKASSLKTRLSSYLKNTDFRIRKMIATAKKLQSLTADSDIEALILESQYIKKHKPLFNIMMRDDKQYFYVGFKKEKFPKIFLSHQPNSKYRNIARPRQASGKAKDISNFVGPFTDGTALKTTLRYLRRIFPYCTCKKPHNNFCLNYHIGKCLGFCCLKTTSATYNFQLTIFNAYQKNIRSIKDILSGKKKLLLKNLEKEKIALGKKHEFEKAIELQNKIKKIKRVFENAQIISSTRIAPSTNKLPWKTICREIMSSLKLPHLPHRIEGYDVANLQGKHAVGAMVVFIDGKPNKNEYRKFRIKNFNMPTFRNFEISAGGDVGMLKEILTRRFNHSEWPLPDLILIDGGKAQLNAANSIVTELLKCPTTVISLTKNEKHRGEKIYVARRKSPIPLSQLPISVKNLLLQINSEAHRFTINYHRKLYRRSLV